MAFEPSKRLKWRSTIALGRYQNQNGPTNFAEEPRPLTVSFSLQREYLPRTSGKGCAEFGSIANRKGVAGLYGRGCPPCINFLLCADVRVRTCLLAKLCNTSHLALERVPEFGFRTFL